MIVVDASILARFVGNDGPAGDQARAIILSAESVAIPDLADLETLSVLRKWWFAGQISGERCEAAIADLTAMRVMRYPAAGFLSRIFELRDNVTPYDAVYVALAESLGFTLITADERLARAPGSRCTISLVGGSE